MSAIIIEIVFIALLLIANGVFAMSEIAVISSRKARLQRMAAGGDRRARAAIEMAEAPDRFLSTVQIGITLVGILTVGIVLKRDQRTGRLTRGKPPPVI